MALTFGFEFEVHGNGPAVLDVLFRGGHVANDHLHPYHCGDGGGCTECAHDYYGEDGEVMFSAQRDETVSAEFPSKILEWGTEQAERAFLVMEHAAVTAGADLSGNSGMHVHVVKPDPEPGEADYDWQDDPHDRPARLTERQATTWRLLRIFARYQDDLELVAHGARSGMRAYGNSRVQVGPDRETFWNHDIDSGPAVVKSPRYPLGRVIKRATQLASGSWLEIDRHRATYEFRLWNATAAAWRQRLAVGLSVAMVTAAMAGEDVTEDDPRSLAEVLHSYTDDETLAALARQFNYKGKA